MQNIVIKGARSHNLKNIDLVIPRDKLIVITGLSGSGKSTLAFDTIFAEGQRRYVESLSAYARQFLTRMERPEVDHIDGLSISVTSANLYSKQRDDLVLFYFRNGANHASVYTQSKIISENIKWNLKVNKKKIKALLINTRNANAFTGKDGFKGLKILADVLSQELTQKQKT